MSQWSEPYAITIDKEILTYIDLLDTLPFVPADKNSVVMQEVLMNVESI
jgi:hypothetical protein